LDRQAKAGRSRHRATKALVQPPPEKCDVNACANEPKPPRVTWLELESDEVPEDELGEESPLKKLLRDDDPPT
jgi:hypothetical protein